MGKFLLQRFVYLVILVVIATAFTYFLAAVALNPRSNFEGRNPPPPPAVVEATLTELNLNDKTPVLQRFERWVDGLRHEDLGRTVDGGSVNAEMGRRVGVSLRLLLIRRRNCGRRPIASPCSKAWRCSFRETRLPKRPVRN